MVPESVPPSLPSHDVNTELLLPATTPTGRWDGLGQEGGGGGAVMSLPVSCPAQRRNTVFYKY